jgi:hypothetical protein
VNLRYLGDALDHWKGSLFESLQRATLLRDFAVDPMATDAENWQTADFALFAQLLRVRHNQIVSHRHALAIDRESYFREITHQGDLFLDPDTGIATSRVRDVARHLLPAEIHDLLHRQPSRVIAVYQHIRAQRTRDRLEKVLSVLRLPDQLFTSCSYESGTVAMLFFSRDLERVNNIYHYFEEFLGKHAARRIHRWHHLLQT